MLGSVRRRTLTLVLQSERWQWKAAPQVRADAVCYYRVHQLCSLELAAICRPSLSISGVYGRAGRTNSL